MQALIWVLHHYRPILIMHDDPPILIPPSPTETAEWTGPVKYLQLRHTVCHLNMKKKLFIEAVTVEYNECSPLEIHLKLSIAYNKVATFKWYIPTTHFYFA